MVLQFVRMRLMQAFHGSTHLDTIMSILELSIEQPIQWTHFFLIQWHLLHCGTKISQEPVQLSLLLPDICIVGGYIPELLMVPGVLRLYRGIFSVRILFLLLYVPPLYLMLLCQKIKKYSIQLPPSQGPHIHGI